MFGQVRHRQRVAEARACKISPVAAAEIDPLMHLEQLTGRPSSRRLGDNIMGANVTRWLTMKYRLLSGRRIRI